MENGEWRIVESGKCVGKWRMELRGESESRECGHWKVERREWGVVKEERRRGK